MKVRAKLAEGKIGFDGAVRRRDGDEFEIDDKLFDATWMISLDEKRRGRPPKSEHVAETEGAE